MSYVHFSFRPCCDCGQIVSVYTFTNFRFLSRVLAQEVIYWSKSTLQSETNVPKFMISQNSFSKVSWLQVPLYSYLYMVYIFFILYLIMTWQNTLPYYKKSRKFFCIKYRKSGLRVYLCDFNIIPTQILIPNLFIYF